MDVFDADSAMAPHFVLSQLGSDKAGPKASSLETVSLVKGGLLSGQYPPKMDGKELKILVQPETQHRARYLTEGSRGSVKDRTQQSFPQVKLDGVSEPVMLQVFVASDAGRVKPHGFYQACKVTGRNTTACKETEIEGTTVIEIPLEPSGDMTLAVDCVGILKLRNADVEARIGVAGSKKKSTRARLAFRVNIPQADGSVLTLQTPSSPILCTQPAGVPEILKKSLHSSSATGGQEVFIIGKNFLKGTKVIFQENVSDDTSWKAEAKIDMDLFHQNHLIVTVPPYHNLSITSPTTVGIFIMTNAGRSHDAQTFTYTPESVDSKKLLAIKTEGTLKANNACLFEGHLKSMTSEQAETSGQPPKPQEITPMEVTSNPTQTDVFKAPTETLVSAQNNLELSPSAPPSVESFPGPMPLQPEDVELPQAPPVFPSLEPLGGLQKQDVSPTPSSYPVSADTTLPPVPPEVPQQFLRDPQESVSPEAPAAAAAAAAAHGVVVVVALPQMSSSSAPSQPQPQQASLFPPEGVAQLERAVMELQAEGGGSLQQVFEAAVAQQQLNSVLYSPAPSAESLQQHVQENMNSLCLALNALQQQQQQQQNQVLSSIQQQQQNQVLSSIQQQQQKQVLNIIQQQQQQNQALSSLQQQQNQALQQQQLQEQQDLEIYKNQFQPQILCPQPLASSQAPQSVSLLQQAGSELLTLQTSFPLQQQQQPAAAHTSPPHQLFQSPGALPESQSPQQQQVQAALLPSALAALTGVSLSPERQSPGSSALFLSAGPQQPPPQQQQTGLAFLSSMETSASEPQSIGLFPNPPQQSMPMEQQQQQPPQGGIPGGPQGSLFQVLPGQDAPLLPQSQPQSTGQLLCTTDLSPQALPPALLFSTQSQDAPALGGLGARVAMPQQQQDAAEPMSFQDQSSLGGGGGGGARRRGLYQEQQPMQVAPCPGAGVPGGQPVELFLPQASSISGLQSSMDTRELRTQATASGATIFVVQGGVGVGVVGAPGQQQPADRFFQSSVGGNAPAQGQPKVFVFGIQNDPSQLLSPSGPGLAAQSQPQNLQPLLDAPMAQTPSSRQAPMHSGLVGPLQTNLQEQMASAMQTGTQSALQSSLQALETTLPTPMQTGLGTQLQGGLQNSLPASANMEKIEDLLDSLQKQL
ncbi:unnamed protein product [Arctogadus glacialis]